MLYQTDSFCRLFMENEDCEVLQASSSIEVVARYYTSALMWLFLMGTSKCWRWKDSLCSLKRLTLTVHTHTLIYAHTVGVCQYSRSVWYVKSQADTTCWLHRCGWRISYINLIKHFVQHLFFLVLNNNLNHLSKRSWIIWQMDLKE